MKRLLPIVLRAALLALVVGFGWGRVAMVLRALTVAVGDLRRTVGKLTALVDAERLAEHTQPAGTTAPAAAGCCRTDRRHGEAEPVVVDIDMPPPTAEALARAEQLNQQAARQVGIIE